MTSPRLSFLRLVKKASKLPKSLPLTAWCHRETHSASVDYVRSEVRRQKREKTAADLDAMKTSSESWDQLTPEVDGAIDELSESDRALVLLRFYNNKIFPRDRAHELGINHDTARMRTNRALEKLRVILAKRGITTTTALTRFDPADQRGLFGSRQLSQRLLRALLQSTVRATTGALAFVKSHLLALGFTLHRDRSRHDPANKN